MKIETDYDPAAIKPRSHHWSAIDADTYDGAEDSHPRCRIVGHGATEAEAIADFQAQLAELA